MAETHAPDRRARNPTWAMLWFVSLLAGEWVVLRLHYEDWRASSPRITWLLDYGCMAAIGVGSLLMTKRVLSDPIYRGGRVFLISIAALLCMFNLSLVLLTWGEAWCEVRDGVDLERPEVARLHGTHSDLVVYHDSAREGVLVDAVTDVMVQHHGFPWQHKLLRLNSKGTRATLERDASGVKLVLLDLWEGHVVSAIDLDWN